jgi:putative acetyltransferase
MEFIIRNEQPQDIDQVRTILRSTFATEAESNLVDALRANGKAVISLVAVGGEGVLGHILFSPVTTTPPHEAKGVGLAPVAVRPDVQAKGIGSKLVQEGLHHCKLFGFDYCVVLGNPKYYERFGFRKASDDGIQNEYGVDQEFMWVRLSNSTVGGLVRYAPEFAAFSV